MWSKIVILKFINIELLNIKLYSTAISENVSSKEHISTGYFAHYYQISPSKGIKLLHQPFNTYKEAICSKEYQEALKEVDLLNKAKSRFNRVPRCYRVRVILQEVYRVGIVLQHLGEETVGIGCSIYQLQNDLCRAGITHKDLHGSNIMRYKGELWVIDFSPEYIEIT